MVSAELVDQYFLEWENSLDVYNIKYIFIAPYENNYDNIKEMKFIEKLNLTMVYKKDLVTIYETK